MRNFRDSEGAVVGTGPAVIYKGIFSHACAKGTDIVYACTYAMYPN